MSVEQASNMECPYGGMTSKKSNQQGWDKKASDLHTSENRISPKTGNGTVNGSDGSAFNSLNTTATPNTREISTFVQHVNEKPVSEIHICDTEMENGANKVKLEPDTDIDKEPVILEDNTMKIEQPREEYISNVGQAPELDFGIVNVVGGVDVDVKPDYLAADYSQSDVDAGKVTCGGDPRVRYPCPICGKLLANRGVLSRHKKLHLGLKPFKCPECDMSFAEKGNLASHVRTHSGLKPHHCPICNKAFGEKGNVKKHMRMHIGDKPHECPECGKCFAERSNLREHIKIHSGERPYTCEHCGGKFSTASNLKQHIMIHTGEKPHECKICKKGFANRSMLVRHEVSHIDVNDSGNTFNGECGELLPDVGPLVKHMRTASGIESYQCTICKKVFTRPNRLMNHMKLHLEREPFQCLVCNKLFSLKSNLNIHMRSHTDDRPFSCEICGKTFTRKANLTVHNMVHTGDKPYQCTVALCEKTFANRGSLSSHMRIHSGEKPFACEICDKTFTMNNHLKVHIRSHTGEKPFLCTICKRRFQTSGGLNTHIRLKRCKIKDKNEPAVYVTSGNDEPDATDAASVV